MRLASPFELVKSTQVPEPWYPRFGGDRKGELLLGDDAAKLALDSEFCSGRWEAPQRAPQYSSKFNFAKRDRFLPLLPLLPTLCSPFGNGHAIQDVDMDGPSLVPVSSEWLGSSNNTRPPSADQIFAFNVTPGPGDTPVFRPLDPAGRSTNLRYNPDFRPFSPGAPILGEHVLDWPATADHHRRSISTALARWYVDQVLTLLVKPGQFRSGVGGASDSLWDSSSTEQESWRRLGYNWSESEPWRTVNELERPSFSRQCSRPRSAVTEPLDPWHVTWRNRPDRSETLVDFVYDIIHRMHITPTAIVAAVWFLMGLGFHEADGQKGKQIRKYLRDEDWVDSEAVEKRVAALGMLLAGKWLDDSSYNIKSWNELTWIPIQDFQRMERCALADFNYSLYLPVSTWVGHVNSLYGVIVGTERDGPYLVVRDVLVTLSQLAHASEVSDPSTSNGDLWERLLEPRLPAARWQASARDWAAWPHASSMIPAHDGPDIHFTESGIFDSLSGADEENEQALIQAERAVGLLVDEEDIIVDGLDEFADEDEEEEFVEYDGASRFLPPLPQTRRAPQAANAAIQPISGVDQQRQTLPPIRLAVGNVWGAPSSAHEGFQSQHGINEPAAFQPGSLQYPFGRFERPEWRMREVPDQALHSRLPLAWYEQAFRSS